MKLVAAVEILLQQGQVAGHCDILKSVPASLERRTSDPIDVSDVRSEQAMNAAPIRVVKVVGEDRPF